MNSQGKRMATKNRILESSRKIFAQKGYKGATIAKIAQEADISEGAIYRHFSSKEDLLTESVEPVLETIINSLDDKILKANNLRDLMIEVTKMRLRLFEEHYETFRIIFNELPYSKEMVNLYMDFIQKQNEKVAEMFRDIKNLGGIRRKRNSLLFGLGQVTSLWFYLNFKKWTDTEGIELPEEILNTTEEHVIEDLTDFVLYGFSGSHEKEL